MSDCAKCGNKFLSGSGGICYTCNRIHRDQVRYGRRSARPQVAAIRHFRDSNDPTPLASEQQRRSYLQAKKRRATAMIKLAQGINHFLSSLCGTQRQVSAVLLEHDFEEERLARLRHRRVTLSLRLASEWIRLLEEKLGRAQARAFALYFSLLSVPRVDSALLADCPPIAPQAVEQVRRGLSELRADRRHFEAVIVQLARELT